VISEDPDDLFLAGREIEVVVFEEPAEGFSLGI